MVVVIEKNLENTQISQQARQDQPGSNLKTRFYQLNAFKNFSTRQKYVFNTNKMLKRFHFLKVISNSIQIRVFNAKNVFLSV